MSQPLRVGLVGATGAVGAEFLRLLEQRRFPISELRLLASERSVGKRLSFMGEELPVAEATPDALAGLDVAFFSAGASRSRALAPAAIDAGAVVIDNSSAFRMDDAVPLVVPEVNGDVLTREHRLIAVPNCSAIILLMAVAPLRKLGTIERLIVSTYQSASGGGAGLMRRLVDETQTALEGADPDALDLALSISDPAAPVPYAFNLFSHNTPIQENGYNEEEAKVIQESRKILGDPGLRVNVTCVRVPVLRAHSESITVEFPHTAPAVEDVREVLADAPGVKVVDDRASNRFPTPLDASGKDDVLVGRIRLDLSNPRAVCLFAVGDQLRKGAALNAVQIAERVFGL